MQSRKLSNSVYVRGYRDFTSTSSKRHFHSSKSITLLIGCCIHNWKTKVHRRGESVSLACTIQKTNAKKNISFSATKSSSMDRPARFFLVSGLSSSLISKSYVARITHPPQCSEWEEDNVVVVTPNTTAIASLSRFSNSIHENACVGIISQSVNSSVRTSAG